MFVNIWQRKQKLALSILLLIGGIILIEEKFKHAEDQKPLLRNREFFRDKVLMWEAMLIQDSPWKLNATAVMQYREELGQCCNASHLLVVTKENAPLGSTIYFNGDKNNNITVDSKLSNDLLPRFPLAGSRYNQCALIGNGGILKGSKCGQQIDQADFIIRFNLPPLSRTEDVGTKTHLVTINPSIFSIRFRDMESFPMAFINVIQTYQNAFFLLPALSYKYHLQFSYNAINVLNDFGLAHRAFFVHPHYLADLDTYWKEKGMREIRLTSGFIFTSVALEFCDHITLYGFWPFLYDLTGKPIDHHYYDNVLPNPFIHAMPEEFCRYLNMSVQGVLRIQLGKCQRGGDRS